MESYKTLRTRTNKGLRATPHPTKTLLMDTQRKDKAEKWWKLATIFLLLATLSGILAFIECIKNA